MKILRVVFFLILTFFINGLLQASVPTPVSGSSPTCWPPPCVPIDNGILFLMIAGGLFGAKKIYDSYKKTSTQL